MSHRSSRLRGSSPVVGSSRNSTLGRPTRLAARSSRRRMPPENVLTSVSAASVRSSRSSSSSARWRASRLGQVVQAADHLEVEPGAEQAVDGGLLRGDADAAAHLVGLVDDVEAGDASPSPRWATASVVRMRIAVVLPAPLWPSRPSTVPGATSRSRSRSAHRSPKRLPSPSARTPLFGRRLRMVYHCVVHSTTNVAVHCTNGNEESRGHSEADQAGGRQAHGQGRRQGGEAPRQGREAAHHRRPDLGQGQGPGREPRAPRRSARVSRPVDPRRARPAPGPLHPRRDRPDRRPHRRRRGLRRPVDAPPRRRARRRHHDAVPLRPHQGRAAHARERRGDGRGGRARGRRAAERLARGDHDRGHALPGRDAPPPVDARHHATTSASGPTACATSTRRSRRWMASRRRSPPSSTSSSRSTSTCSATACRSAAGRAAISGTPPPAT